MPQPQPAAPAAQPRNLLAEVVARQRDGFLAMLTQVEIEKAALIEHVRQLDARIAELEKGTAAAVDAAKPGAKK